jgi:hypothetical protein
MHFDTAQVSTLTNINKLALLSCCYSELCCVDLSHYFISSFSTAVMTNIDRQLCARFQHEHSNVYVCASDIHDFMSDCAMCNDTFIQDKGKAADHKRSSSSSSSSGSTAVELSQLAFLQYTSGSTRYTLNCNHFKQNSNRCRLHLCAHMCACCKRCAKLPTTPSTAILACTW